MDLNNEDDLKNKEDLHIAGRHTALDLFRFMVFLWQGKQSQLQILIWSLNGV